MSGPGSDTFGNYMLHDLMETGRTFQEIQLPPAVSWWPQTPGWSVVAVLLAAWAGCRLYGVVRRWWHNRYRREALAQIEQIASLSPTEAAARLSLLLRAAALHTWPRRQVVSLSGSRWLQWLAQTTPAFDSPLGQRWLTAQYQPPERCPLTVADRDQLCMLGQHWINHHPDFKTTVTGEARCV